MSEKTEVPKHRRHGNSHIEKSSSGGRREIQDFAVRVVHRQSLRGQRDLQSHGLTAIKALILAQIYHCLRSDAAVRSNAKAVHSNTYLAEQFVGHKRMVAHDVKR